MIVLDAGVLIALNDPTDAHHASVARFLEANADGRLVANGVTIAESLVHVASEGVLGEVLEDYELLGIEALDVAGTSAGLIARIRSETRLRMPDVLVLYTCEREHADLVTTDTALARVATARGVRAHLLT